VLYLTIIPIATLITLLSLFLVFDVITRPRARAH